MDEQGIAPESVRCVWSDTQGHVAHVIESGRSLWSAGVRCFAELWPPGLKAHTGMDWFVQLVTENFDQLIERTPLRNEGAAAQPLPITEIEAVMNDWKGQSDALFLPVNFREG